MKVRDETYENQGFYVRGRVFSRAPRVLLDSEASEKTLCCSSSSMKRYSYSGRGMKRAKVMIKGTGRGRDAALRAIRRSRIL
ncbi:hypothetical protein HPP92_006949 [Vanilla planifolia]|uniref:Uncharacterized protein n=1 Tax=Vanilla planifolia TaxID=51239 RepID=A0A835RD45_VANPL|nr:hypothetical protein HPP92_006949 [Vanilla planifolia]